MYWSTQFHPPVPIEDRFEPYEQKRPTRRSLRRPPNGGYARSASADQRPINESVSEKPKKRLSFRKNLTRAAKNFSSGLSSFATSLSTLPQNEDETKTEENIGLRS